VDADEFSELAFFRAIQESGARALLIGRRALIALGLPVSTVDYDFWLHRDDIEHFNAALVPLDFAASQTPEGARARCRYVLDNSEHVDVLVARQVTTQDGEQVSFESVWDARERLELSSEVSVNVPSLDDLIRTKRFGGRARDLQDIRLLEALRRRRP
jgi:hypothetical protein